MRAEPGMQGVTAKSLVRDYGMVSRAREHTHRLIRRGLDRSGRVVGHHFGPRNCEQLSWPRFGERH
jgi:hypothetical protein